MDKGIHPDAHMLITGVNELRIPRDAQGGSLRWSKPHRFGSDRLHEGYTAADLVLVVEHRSLLWAGDSKMAQHLTQQTLFRKVHWPDYLDAAKAWDEDGRPSPRSTQQSAYLDATFNLPTEGF